MAVPILFSNDTNGIARLVQAFLEMTPPAASRQWLYKVLALAKLCEGWGTFAYSEHHILPAGLRTWSVEELKDLYIKAAVWLEAQ